MKAPAVAAPTRSDAEYRAAPGLSSTQTLTLLRTPATYHPARMRLKSPADHVSSSGWSSSPRYVRLARFNRVDVEENLFAAAVETTSPHLARTIRPDPDALSLRAESASHAREVCRVTVDRRGVEPRRLPRAGGVPHIRRRRPVAAWAGVGQDRAASFILTEHPDYLHESTVRVACVLESRFTLRAAADDLESRAAHDRGAGLMVDELHIRQAADAAWRCADRTAKALSSEIDALRSLGASVRQAYQVVGTGRP